MEYVIPAGLVVFAISGLIAVKVGLAKRPTFKEAEAKYKGIEVCGEIHKRVDENLECIPEIKENVTKILTILEVRNKKQGG